MPARRIVCCSIALALLAGPSAAGAQPPDDFATSGGAWNSVSELMQIARQRGVEPRIAERLDVGTLGPTDSLLILHPRAALPARELTAFLRSGGRVLLADDFGAGDSLLEAFPDRPHGALRRGGAAAAGATRPCWWRAPSGATGSPPECGRS
ncbi:MAG: DUF4350 domain-containing protein [Sandaracinaceae bacterium]|nr:DUF4350 domain-containing protein [Sandaracinaceae bacterium]